MKIAPAITEDAATATYCPKRSFWWMGEVFEEVDIAFVFYFAAKKPVGGRYSILVREVRVVCVCGQ